LPIALLKLPWFIESKGLVLTAEKFSDSVYDYFETMADDSRTFAGCRDPIRAVLGYKCLSFKKKYTVVFIETETEITIVELISSKLIKW